MNPVNTDPTETYRADYSDIGYPNIGFSPYVKGWVNGYLTPDDGAILPLKRKPILHEINGQADVHQEIARLGELIKEKELDVIFVGIGNNCHLAFNDPPADFTTNPYLLVELDKTCRRQQVKGGWFANLADVPQKAIPMSIHQIMQGKHIIALVQGSHKAQALSHALEGQVSRLYPASILQNHHDVSWFIDKAAAARLQQK